MSRAILGTPPANVGFPPGSTCCRLCFALRICNWRLIVIPFVMPQLVMAFDLHRKPFYPGRIECDVDVGRLRHRIQLVENRLVEIASSNITPIGQPGALTLFAAPPKRTWRWPTI